MAKPSKLAGALAKDPKLNRASFNVYRNAQGGLVNSRGGTLPGQRPQRLQQPIEQVPGRYLPQPLPQTQSSTPGRMPPMRPQMPNVQAPSQVSRDAYDMERIAQERARAIQNGGRVTMDYNPQRDNRVNEILGRMPQGKPGMFQKPGQLSPEEMNRIGMGQDGNPAQLPPQQRNPMYAPPQNQMPPMGDLMYRYPQSQTADFEAMFQQFQQQQRQQPNTVFGPLQQGRQQQPMPTLVAEQPQNAQQLQQPQAPNPYMKQY